MLEIELSLAQMLQFLMTPKLSPSWPGAASGLKTSVPVAHMRRRRVWDEGVMHAVAFGCPSPTNPARSAGPSIGPQCGTSPDPQLLSQLLSPAGERRAERFGVFHSFRLAVATASLMFACFLLAPPTFAQTGTLPVGLDLSDPQLIARGSTLFAQSCSVGYCHGVAGKAGRGPRLRGREWDKNYLYKVTFEGISNSSMPAWKDRLTEREIGAVVAYILTLSKLTSDSAEAPVPAAAATSEPAPASERSSTRPESSPTDISLLGNPEKGRALFFDSSNDWHCAACHRIGGAGASVGPELNGVKSKAVKDLFIDIVLPSARLSPERPFLHVTTKSGEQIQAVKSEESPSHIKLYDIGSLPAVLRNLPKDQIQKLDIQSRSAMPAKYGETYTVKQLLDIIAFLKAGGSGPAQTVNLNDLR